MNLQTLSFHPARIIPTDLPDEQQAITDMLYWLGISEKYTGFDYLSYAILLVLRQPERLCLATKWLYPDVAKHYRTNWQTVERGMRYAINLVWTFRRAQLQQLAQHELDRRPCIVQFLVIIIDYLTSYKAA